jgi:protein TonB
MRLNRKLEVLGCFVQFLCSGIAPAAEATPPLYVHNPPPQYSKESRAAGEQGRVVVRALIAEDGSPIKVELLSSSGHSRLDEAAIEAVAKWKFKPATRDGEPVQDWASIPIRFVVDDK